MSILLFAVWFSLINVLLLKWIKNTLSCEYNEDNVFYQNIMFVKGSVRVLLGKCESSMSLEEKRNYLERENVKF